MLNWTPLHDAAAEGSTDTVKLLLASMAKVNPKDIDRRTALDSAAFNGHKGVAEFLLAHGAEANDHDAIAVGDLDKVEALLKGKPNLASEKDTVGMTPLHWVARLGRKNVA